MAMKNIIISLFLLLLSSHTAAEIAIIGRMDNEQQQLTVVQVQDIFMGRTRAFPGGRFALPFDQMNLREEFYQKLTDRPIAQINSYWACLMFSGQTSPPTKLSDDQSMIKMVRENEGAIGYIDKINADEQIVRILLLLTDVTHRLL